MPELSFDTLSRVFRYGLEITQVPLHYSFLAAVSGVSREWRMSAIEDPYLWVDIYADVTDVRRAQREIIALYLERSKSLPLGVHLTGDPSSDTLSQWATDGRLGSLLSSTARWETLFVISENEVIAAILLQFSAGQTVQAFPTLQTVQFRYPRRRRICGHPWGGGEENLAYPPRLNAVIDGGGRWATPVLTRMRVISGFLTRDWPMFFSLAKVTTLELGSDMWWSELYDVLSRTPLLQRLKISRHVSHEFPVSQPAVLPYLRDVQLSSAEHGSFTTRVFALMSCPRLERLGLAHVPPEPLPLPRNQKSLHTVIIHSDVPRYAKGDICAFFRSVPSLQRLYLMGALDIGEILKELTEEIQDPERDWVILPDLSVLAICLDYGLSPISTPCPIAPGVVKAFLEAHGGIRRLYLSTGEGEIGVSLGRYVELVEGLPPDCEMDFDNVH